MHFLSPNKQCQRTDGRYYIVQLKTSVSCRFLSQFTILYSSDCPITAERKKIDFVKIMATVANGSGLATHGCLGMAVSGNCAEPTQQCAKHAYLRLSYTMSVSVSRLNAVAVYCTLWVAKQCARSLGLSQ